MHDVYWFLDSTTTNGKDYFVIGGIGGELPSITEAYNKLNLTKKSKGRKFVKKPENLRLANTVLNNLIDSEKIFVFGTVFNQSKIPHRYQQEPDLFRPSDNPEEIGTIGMWGRAYAQTVWCFMDYVLKQRPDINPIVCLDREDKVILQSVEFHVKNQLKKLRPDYKFRVQSENMAIKNENNGHRVSDVISSLIRGHIKSPDQYKSVKDLITKTIKFDSRLLVQEADETNWAFRTDPVTQWDL